MTAEKVRERVHAAILTAARRTLVGDGYPLGYAVSATIAAQAADAVLAVVADVDGIAGVLDAHRLAPIDEHPDWTCRCGQVIAYAGLHLDLRPLILRHQAEAVAAHMRGEG